jgi:membrane peptidoglycan carboxypeptidase
VSPLQMASGYATLANHGVHCEPVAITRVVDRTGDTIFRAKPDCQRAVPASVADEATAMLENVIEMGTGTAANIGRPAAGKTGTGQEYQDAWFVGFTPQLTTAVWVGYARAEIPMPNVPGYGRGFGGTLAAPIWHDFMLFALRTEPALSFRPPPIPFGYVYSSPTPTFTPTSPPPLGGGGGGDGNGPPGDGTGPPGNGNGHGPPPGH